MELSRRAVLAGAGTAGLAGVAGCLRGTAGHVRPDQDPELVPESLECEDEGFERHQQAHAEEELRWGNAAGFSLRVNDVAFDYGEAVEISLTYTSIGSHLTGNKYQYNFELYTADGWQEVRGGEGPFVYTDEGFKKLTGQGWSWEIELTERGIADATTQEIAVCPSLQSGRYRFVYWGIAGVDEAVAVAFDITRDS